MLALLSAAPALLPASVPARAGPVVMAERSASIPFLKKPPALDGSMVGDVGFDPLGFSTTITELGGDLRYVRFATPS
jgi:light-harvesting complex I chlorophyll a/b binding protein 1